MAQQINFFFDWDDNVVSMPTKIMLQNKKTAEEFAISTQEFAKIREEIGQPGRYFDFQIDPHPHTGTMRYFRDDPKGQRNFFLEDTMRGVLKGSFRSKSFAAFQMALSNAETAKNTFIITARGHSRENFKAGLRCLKKIGWIKYLMPLENIWGVSSPDFPQNFKSAFGEEITEVLASSPSLAKTEIMIRLHDRINRKPLSRTCSKACSKACIAVVSPNGNQAGVFHLSGFSDDDLGNYETGRNVFVQWIKEGRWPRIKFTLFFTGLHGSGPKTEVLTSNGLTRTLLPNEESEWMRVFEAKYGRSPEVARQKQAGALSALFGARSAEALSESSIPLESSIPPIN